jgi:glyoxylase-like metal-dependent hydrolase (beta-lactamase superfamily II)
MKKPNPHFSIGTFTISIISDGETNVPVFPTFAINANKEEVVQILKNNSMDQETYLLQCNIMYINNGQDKILIDTGAGKILGNNLGKLLGNLANLGVDNKDINKILLTHCHPDHIGGLVSEDGNLNFPNAEVYINETEWDFWRKSNIDLSPIKNEHVRSNMLKGINMNLKPIDAHIKTFKYNQEVISGITAVDAAGHSPGHTAFLIFSDNESLLHTADVFHNPVFDLSHPHWSTLFDYDVKKSYATRLKILDQACSDKSLISAYHVPFPGLGIVSKNSNAYEWHNPLNYLYKNL